LRSFGVSLWVFISFSPFSEEAWGARPVGREIIDTAVAHVAAEPASAERHHEL
jgi:hypothetical protein